MLQWILDTAFNFLKIITTIVQILFLKFMCHYCKLTAVKQYLFSNNSIKHTNEVKCLTMYHSWFTTLIESNAFGPVFPAQVNLLKYEDHEDDKVHDS